MVIIIYDYLSSTLTETHISNNYNNSTYDNLYLCGYVKK